MTTSKPMSDGGKGSVRRNEDTEAYRNNFDNIFRKKEVKPMEDHEDDEGGICPACNGSGEGMHESDTCYKCHGYGEIGLDGEDEDDSDY